MDALQSLHALLNAPVIIDDDIWPTLIKRNRSSIKAMRHLAVLLQDIYKTLLFNREEKVYFLNVAQLKIKRLKVEIELSGENKFFIKVSQDRELKMSNLLL